MVLCGEASDCQWLLPGTHALGLLWGLASAAFACLSLRFHGFHGFHSALLCRSSVNLGPIVYQNDQKLTYDMAQRFTDTGIKPQVEVFDTNMISNADNLVKQASSQRRCGRPAVVTQPPSRCLALPLHAGLRRRANLAPQPHKCRSLRSLPSPFPSFSSSISSCLAPPPATRVSSSVRSTSGL